MTLDFVIADQPIPLKQMQNGARFALIPFQQHPHQERPWTS
jgi:hypothetical protein